MNNKEEKVVNVQHAFSGKELVIVNTTEVIQEYFEQGYVVMNMQADWPEAKRGQFTYKPSGQL